MYAANDLSESAAVGEDVTMGCWTCAEAASRPSAIVTCYLVSVPAPYPH